jgi:putative transposase
VKNFKRDYADRMDCRHALTVLRKFEAGLEHYTEVHPHRASKMLSPRMFRRRNAQSSSTACPEIQEQLHAVPFKGWRRG